MNHRKIFSSRPKKSLGQNYLIDENICRKIVDTFEIKPNDTILEIGSGRGEITKYILERTKDVIAVEFDQVNSEYLKIHFPSAEIIHGDILDLDITEYKRDKGKLRVIGNIPYNLTSPILFKMIDRRRYIKDVQIMIQEEVAQRFTASPDSKQYGITSVLLQTFADVKLLFRVSPNCFYPKPKVNSRIIYVKFKNTLEKKIKDETFYKYIVRTSFNPRRKMLKNTLSQYRKEMSEINFDWTRRAENLSIEEFIFITNEILKLNENF